MIGGRLVLGQEVQSSNPISPFHTKRRNPARFPNNPVSNHKLANDHKIHTKTNWMAQFVTRLWGSKLKVICLTRKTTGIADPTIPTTPASTIIIIIYSSSKCSYIEPVDNRAHSSHILAGQDGQADQRCLPEYGVQEKKWGGGLSYCKALDVARISFGLPRQMRESGCQMKL